MTRLLVSAAIAATIAFGTPSAALALQPSASTSATDKAFAKRAAQLVDLMNGKIAFADYFDPSFQSAVPEAQFKAFADSLIAQYGRAVAVEKTTSADGRSGTILLRFEKGVATVLLDVGLAADERVTGLRVTGFTVANDRFDKVAAEIAALPGQTGFLVAELGEAGIRPLAAVNADRQFAVGSTIKLYILDELAAQITAGQRKWSDVVPLSHFSFSSRQPQNWPADTR